MEKFIKLMGDNVFSCIFGFIMTLIPFFACAGEPNTWAFSLIFGAICLVAKFVVSSQMCDLPFSKTRAIYSVGGLAFAMIIGLFLL